MPFRPLEGASVVFDLDGTIADTAPDLIAAANAALVAAGYDAVPPDAIKPGVGYGTKAMLRSALSFLGQDAPPDRLQTMADRLVAHYEDHIAVGTTLFPGFVDAADALRNDGARLFVCTNKIERLALRLLSRLDIESLFSGVAGGDTFPFHKPDPRHITELVTRGGGDPLRCIMVGDSEADIAAAQAAGVYSVAVSFGYAAVPALELRANAVIAHFDKLFAIASDALKVSTVS